ncbi:SUMO-targeted ubiquitin ligase complex subunit slx8 [Ascosphaera atra]|nr:SUMO-targeted ubiquitin ligase complex subunit slx8 [Ascosphaera atra]
MDGYGEYSDLPDDILEDLLGEGSSQVVPRRRQHSDEDGEPGPSQRQRHEDEVSRDTTQAAQPRRKRRRRGDEGLFVETDDSEAAEESAPTTRGTSLSSIPPQPNITSNGAQSRQLRNGDAGQAGNEAIDLTDVEEQSNLADVLSKQRQDAVLAQTEHAPARSILTGYKCPICMEDLDDATSTVCGMYLT